jgi:hypothetical protein
MNEVTEQRIELIPVNLQIGDCLYFNNMLCRDGGSIDRDASGK